MGRQTHAAGSQHGTHCQAARAGRGPHHNLQLRQGGASYPRPVGSSTQTAFVMWVIVGTFVLLPHNWLRSECPIVKWELENRMRAMPLTSPHKNSIGSPGQRLTWRSCDRPNRRRMDARPPGLLPLTQNLPAVPRGAAAQPCLQPLRVSDSRLATRRLSPTDLIPGTFANPSKARIHS